MSCAEDPRRRIPRTDALLALPEAAAVGPVVAKQLIRAVQDDARAGRISPDDVEPRVRALLAGRRGSLRRVINATGVVVHTNLGRAPLSARAQAAIAEAAGYTDVEFDLPTGMRARRGAGALAALTAACPAAEDALIVNNGAAALLLAARAQHRPVLLSRGEFIEIGAGFRLADLLREGGVELVEVGAANRTHLSDYDAPGTILSVHRSNFRVEGFTSRPDWAELAELAHARGDVLIVDVGSGLMAPEPGLPDEPDMRSALEAGADIVIASGDKLLGGPQAGIILGTAHAIAALARNPLARAVRADKLTLAGIEATLAAEPPVLTALRTPAEALLERTRALRDRVLAALPAHVRDTALGTQQEAADPVLARKERELAALRRGTPIPHRPPSAAGAPAVSAGAAALDIVAHAGRVGGGGGPGVTLPGWALALPQAAAAPLRTGELPVVAHVSDGRCHIDLRCVAPDNDGPLAEAIAAVLTALDTAEAAES